MKIIPPNKPLIEKEWLYNDYGLEGKGIGAIIRELGPDRPFLIGIRGYYKDSMGVRNENDIGIYDDAMILTSPSAYASFNANVDPSIKKPKVAVLVPGLYRYTKGVHNKTKEKRRQYPALVQASDVTVMRYGVTEPDTGWFGINIHKGSLYTTSSLGCQTIYPKQWDSFIALTYGEMSRYGENGTDYIDYILVTESH